MSDDGCGEDPRWESVVAALPDPVAVLAPVLDEAARIVDLEYVAVNPAAARPLDAPQMRGRRVRSLWPRDMAELLIGWASEVLDSGAPLVRDDVALPPDLVRVAERIDVRGVRVAGSVVFSWRDATDRYRAQQSLREAEARYRLLAENIADVVVQFDVDRRITYASPSVTTLLGYDAEEMVGLRPVDLVHPDDQARVLAALPVPHTGELTDEALHARVRRRDGSYRWVSRTARSLTDADGTVVGGVSTWRDAQREVEFLQDLAVRARTDALTGLLTRRAGWDRLNADLANRRAGSHVAVLFCDLDQFGEVNRRHGHHVGDSVLMTIADRVTGAIRDSDYVIRVGGDEMVVVLNGVADLEAAVRLAEKLRARIAEPVRVGRDELAVTASIGVSLAGVGETVTALLDRADRAMFAAKDAGRDTVVPIR